MRFGITILLAMTSVPLTAQETRQLPVGAKSPSASIAQLGWLTGEWRGEGLGAPATEVYSGALGDRITGHFVQASKTGGIAFQELIQIEPRGASLVYRLRHFNADLTGWEDKTGKAVEFPLVAIDGNTAYFAGLTLRRDGNTLISTVLVREKDGSSHELSFRYRRVPH